MFIVPMIVAMIPIWMDKMSTGHTIREDIGENILYCIEYILDMTK